MVLKGREIRTADQRVPLYEICDGNMYIPIGLYGFVKDYFISVVDNRTDVNDPLRDTKAVVSDIEQYRDVLDGITLRDKQISAICKILALGRCIVQLSTGAGKSEIMCAVVKLLSVINGNKYPTVLILEPTKLLVNDMVDRFRKYDIPAFSYLEEREIVENAVNITHPTALGNDVESNPDLLNTIQVMFGDECHHLQSETMRKPIYAMNSLVYSVGVSASVIHQDHVGSTDITDYTYGELLSIGATGPLVLNATSSELVGKGLAQAVLYMVDNQANEELVGSREGDWHAIQKYRIESDARVNLIAKSAKVFFEKDIKILILVRTIRCAYKVMTALHQLGLTDFTRASFGSGKFEVYNGHDFERDKGDVYERFKNGDYRILVGTTHIYEGADIPNLDVIILGYGGREERLQIQGVGRALRDTKSGKYAHIVDIYDISDPILNNHSRERLKRYSSIIGIPDDRVFCHINVSKISTLYDQLEK